MASATLLLLCAFYISSSYGQQEPMVSTPLFDVTGRSHVVDNRRYSAFLAVPYAQPPLGELRFAPPKMVNRRIPVNASGDFSKDCPKLTFWLAQKYSQDEDCLYLNIWTPASVFPVYSGAYLTLENVSFPAGNYIGKVESRRVILKPLRHEFTTCVVSGELKASGISRFFNLSFLYQPTYTPRIGRPDLFFWAKTHLPMQTAERYPVIVWLHGGAFYLGNGRLNTSATLRNMCRKQITTKGKQIGDTLILCTGFWTTYTDAVPGNQGLLDMLMALKWVQENIFAFGGDKDQVTLGGVSAGAASVSALTLSPLSKGLFRQPLMIGGSAFSPWVFFGDDYSRPSIETFQRKLGCSTSGPQLVDCLRQASVDQLVNATRDTPTTDRMNAFSIWCPRVDGIVFPKGLKELALERQPTNVLIGSSANDAATFSLIADPPAFARTPEDLIVRPSTRNFIGPSSFKNVDFIRKAAQSRYVERRKADAPCCRPESDTYWFARDVELRSALAFWYPQYKDASLYISRGANVYLFSFNYTTHAIPALNWNGTLHTSETYFLFGNDSHYFFSQLGHPIVRPSDDQMMQIMSTLVANFIKYGNPTPAGSTIQQIGSIAPAQTPWQPLNVEDANYLSIDASAVSMKRNYRSDFIAFWTLMEDIDFNMKPWNSAIKTAAALLCILPAVACLIVLK